jgi:hypothetical protein
MADDPGGCEIGAATDVGEEGEVAGIVDQGAKKLRYAPPAGAGSPARTAHSWTPPEEMKRPRSAWPPATMAQKLTWPDWLMPGTGPVGMEVPSACPKDSPAMRENVPTPGAESPTAAKLVMAPASQLGC